MHLLPPSTPNLPLAPIKYQRAYHDQLNNVFRLYFNTLGNTVRALLGRNGGAYLQNPCGQYGSTVDQSVTANTPTQVTFNVTGFEEGISLSSNNIVFERQGYYNLTFWLQMENTAATMYQAYVWLRKNGTTATDDMANTTSQWSVPGNKGAGRANHGFTTAARSYIGSMLPGDYIGLWWAADNAAVTLQHYAAQVTTPFDCPATPSVNVSVAFVSDND